MATVSLPKEISTLFPDANDDFPAIIFKPSKYDVHHLRQNNFAALQDINLRDSTDGTGLILSEDDHKAANRNQVFNRANRALKA